MSITLDLQDFILRARVLKLYRQALRTARRAPTQPREQHQSASLAITKLLSHSHEWVLETAVELQQTIRQEIEKNRDCQDKQKIRFLLSEGRERVKRLDEMLDMQGC